MASLGLESLEFDVGIFFSLPLYHGYGICCTECDFLMSDENDEDYDSVPRKRLHTDATAECLVEVGELRH